MPDSAQEELLLETVNKVIKPIDEVATPSTDNIDLLDAVYFVATLEHVMKELETARRSIRYARTEFESLTVGIRASDFLNPVLAAGGRFKIRIIYMRRNMSHDP
jgi:hypothetical protein